MRPAQAAQPALTAALLLAAVRGFAVLRHSPRHGVVQRPPQRPSLAGQPTRTVVAAGAIDLAANATKGLVEGVVRTVTDNEEYQFGKPRHRRHDSPVPLAQAI